MYSVFAAIAREASVFAIEPESQNYAALNITSAERVNRRALAVPDFPTAAAWSDSIWRPRTPARPAIPAGRRWI
jgi:hypothetical protein